MKEYIFLGIVCVFMLIAVYIIVDQGPEQVTDTINRFTQHEPIDEAELLVIPQLIKGIEAEDKRLQLEYQKQIAVEEFYLAEVTCLAVNIYFEARNQDVEGMNAVAAVTVNRVKSKDYPNTLCNVVFDKCQFSWVCDANIKPFDIADLPKSDRLAYQEAVRIAELFYDVCLGGTDKQSDEACKLIDNTDGAMFYHASYSKPYWTKPEHKFVNTATIGSHEFYRGPES